MHASRPLPSAAIEGACGSLVWIPGTFGPLCSLCIDTSRYYDGLGCVSCTGSGRLANSLGIVAGVLIGVIAGISGFMWIVYNKSAQFTQGIPLSGHPLAFVKGCSRATHELETFLNTALSDHPLAFSTGC